jgi:hypothetical protein
MHLCYYDSTLRALSEYLDQLLVCCAESRNSTSILGTLVNIKAYIMPSKHSLWASSPGAGLQSDLKLAKASISNIDSLQPLSSADSSGAAWNAHRRL